MASESEITAATVAASIGAVEETRRMVVRYVFYSFWVFLAGIAAVMAWRGWDLPPQTGALFSQIFLLLSTMVTGVVGFYLGSSYGSALKDMAARMMPPPPPAPPLAEEKKTA